MTDFQRDIETIIQNGGLVAKNGKIRFWFRNGNILTGDIDKLDLSTRAYNSLKRAHINRIEDIHERWDELGVLRNLGAKSVKEVKNKYVAYYYDSLKTDEERKQFWLDTYDATNAM